MNIPLRNKVTVVFTVLATLAGRPVWGATATINPATTYQSIDGLGGAIAFYGGWVDDHPYKQEIYTNAFAGLNLSMLRLGDWYRYNANFDLAAGDLVSNANRILGHPVPILMSSWSPPAFLKSNGQTGNGGTLSLTNGAFNYAGFAQYWYDSLEAYEAIGVSPTWISIQNEPDWVAGYDSCIFDPTEDTVNGTNYASYAKALDATYQRLTNLPAPPKLLGPEVVGLGYNAVEDYAATMNPSSFYGLAHHLYGGSTDGSPDGYAAAMLALTNVFPGKPKFMTEYWLTNMIETANLIHDCLTVEQGSAFNFWSLVWPVGGAGLVQIENPYNLSSWTNAPPGTTTQAHGYWLTPTYWAMKHFSYFINPGYLRVSATSSDTNVLISAYLSPNNNRLVVVFINTNATTSSAMTLNAGAFSVGTSGVYQTAGTNRFQWLGSLTNAEALPPQSLTTVVLNETNTGSAPLLLHRYSFNETGGTNVADSAGGPAGNGTLPNGGTFSGGQLTLASNLQQYVNLPADLIATNLMTSVTVEAWATFEINPPWATYLFSFGNIDGGGAGGNYLFCSEGGGRFAICGVDPGYLGETNAYTPGLNWSGKTLHLDCVVDATDGYLGIYTNGALAGTNKLGTCTLGSVINHYSFINRSLYASDPSVNLTIKEFRIYSRALSSAEIAATDALGPEQVLNTNRPVVGLTVTGANLTLSWSLASDGFTLQSRTNLVLGNWATVSSPGPKIVGTNYQVALPTTQSMQFFRLSQ